MLFQPGKISFKIFSYGSQYYWPFVEQAEGLGDIAGSAAKLLHHAVYGKANIQNVNLIRENMIGKLPRKVHDAVIREGARNVDVH